MSDNEINALSPLPAKRQASALKNGLMAPTSTDDPLETLISRLKRCQMLASELPKLNLHRAPSPAGVKEEECEIVECNCGDVPHSPTTHDGVVIEEYEDERLMPDIMRLITKDLSEPYSIYTYRYFIHNWPNLCLLARLKERLVGAIVCKLDLSRQNRRRGYIAMLAVDETVRRMKIGTRLVCRAIENMHKIGCDEVVLETEVSNAAALRLYENLGFVREKRLFRYYLNGVDAFRLKLWFSPPPQIYLSANEPMSKHEHHHM